MQNFLKLFDYSVNNNFLIEFHEFDFKKFHIWK